MNTYIVETKDAYGYGVYVITAECQGDVRRMNDNGFNKEIVSITEVLAGRFTYICSREAE